MDINLHFKTDVNGVSPKESLDSNCIHLMPCSIDYNGETAVDKFFDKYLTEEKNERTSEIEYSGSFRGYPLRGKMATVPDDYSFVMMKETKVDEGSRAMKESERFQQFTYWNVSDKPSSSDPFFKAMKWVDTSRIIHDD